MAGGLKTARLLYEVYMNWLYATLSILQQGFMLLLGLQKKSELEEQKDAGKNEHIIDEIKEINKRKSAAADIIERLRRERKADSDK